MRSYSTISPKMWISGTGKHLVEQYSRDHLLVAINLFSSPQSHMSGLYWCPLQHVADQVGLDLDTVDKIIADLEREGFCKYDRMSALIWVIAMLKYQVSETPKLKDNRVQSVIRHVKGLPRSVLIAEFSEYYQIDLKGLDQGACRSPRTPTCPDALPSPASASRVDTGQNERGGER